MANPTLEKQFGGLPGADGAVDAKLAEKSTLPTGAARAMTIGGVAAKTGVLLLFVLAAGAWGWNQIDTQALTVTIPAWWWLVLTGAVVLAIVTAFKPQLAIVTGPLYAVAQGVMLGAISAILDAQYEGIALQAVLATIAVFVVMLVLFVTRTIRVTNRMRGMIIGATFGIMLFYLASIVLSFFNVDIPYVWDSGPIGIGFSLLVVGIAAFNLMLDFDMIERGVSASAPRSYEWYAAFGLMVTIVWLYIEILRLLAKTRN
ncbi:MAG: Bax inhibitor-1/YccA family protein [Acidimicrobiia bacterium]|nr:Bax inhibitor-1/YccA family protein [Acidimicrobiia bacterium]